MPAYIGFYALVRQVAGGRVYRDTRGRLTFIMFLVFSLPVGMHHLFADPEHGAGLKFVQSFLTFFVALPTLLTVFSICASRKSPGGCAAAGDCWVGYRLCLGMSRWGWRA